jgi:hypothetical protein
MAGGLQVNEQRKRSASLGCVSLIAVFFVAVATLGLAYQSKPSYLIDIGAREDKPFVSGFNTREPDLDALAKQHQTLEGPTYRWTRVNSYVNLPGIGSQDITVTLTIAAIPNPDHQPVVFVNEHQVPLTKTVIPAGDAYFPVSFAVPAAWFNDGNLHLHIVSHTFNPTGDSRNLGYRLDTVKVEPLQKGFLPFVRPPTDSFLPLLLIVVLGVLILFSIGVPTSFGVLGGFALTGSLCYWLINDRLSLTILLQQDFTKTLFFTWLGVWVVAEFGPRLYKKLGLAVTRRESGWLAGLFLLQFVLLYGVMLHPQFVASDVGLDVHNLQRVEQGNYFFTTALPNGLLQPYPPSFYLVLWPFTTLTDNAEPTLINLIQLVNAILQASGVFLIYYLAAMLRQLPRQVTDHDLIVREEMEHSWEVGTNWAGLLACGVYIVCRYVYYIFSQGNVTNLFGAWAFLLFFTVTAGTLGYFRTQANLSTANLPAFSNIVHYRRSNKASMDSPPTLPTQSELLIIDQDQELDTTSDSGEDRSVTTPNTLTLIIERWDKQLKQTIWPRLRATLRYLLPLLILVVVLTSHYGVFLFTNVFMVITIGLLGLFGGSRGRRDALYLGIIYGLALLIAFFLYYSNFTDIFAQQFSSFSGISTNKIPKTNSNSFDLIVSLKRLYANSRDDFGLAILLAAGGGILLWLQSWWKARPQLDLAQTKPRHWLKRSSLQLVNLLFGRINSLNALLLSLFLTSSLFALLSEIVGLESRYQLYLLPLIALASGSLLGRLWRSSFAGVIMVSSLFLFQLLVTISYWLSRITYYPG